MLQPGWCHLGLHYSGIALAALILMSTAGHERSAVPATSRSPWGPDDGQAGISCLIRLRRSCTLWLHKLHRSSWRSCACCQLSLCRTDLVPGPCWMLLLYPQTTPDCSLLNIALVREVKPWRVAEKRAQDPRVRVVSAVHAVLAWTAPTQHHSSMLLLAAMDCLGLGLA